MSLLSKELLCDSMTRYHQARSLAAAATVSGGKTTTAAATSSCSSSSSSSTRRRQSAVVIGEVQPRRAITTTITWPRDNVPVRQQRRSFEQIYEPRICQMEIGPQSPTEGQTTLQRHAPVKRNSDVRKLDANNNRLVLRRLGRDCKYMTSMRLVLIVSLVLRDKIVTNKYISVNFIIS